MTSTTENNSYLITKTHHCQTKTRLLTRSNFFKNHNRTLQHRNSQVQTHWVNNRDRLPK